jgi:hypothetical protein
MLNNPQILKSSSDSPWFEMVSVLAHQVAVGDTDVKHRRATSVITSGRQENETIFVCGLNALTKSL